MSDLIPLTGEPLALDLVNTHPTAGDLLATPADLRAWLRLEAERFDEAREPAAGDLGPGDLAAVHDVRAHISRALGRLLRGDQPAADDVEALNQAQRAAPAILELVRNGGAVTATRHRTGTPGARLAAWLAEAGAEFLAGPSVAEVRQCAADDCVMLFLPSHPRRRWCSAARCGNRVRVARHYQRHKATGSA
ncbi:MAG TPA: ABATE domain-containing protein [Yinghuangia sp.]|uniref:CGNR zinc finger domain-containing protein n=1 Tax=Yinghuangia sp. YIM S10712 TaxID=3436930 RepID=UPI002CF0B93B|nr:ABATE domain-containing protein [Yinghuangia sp.]